MLTKGSGLQIVIATGFMVLVGFYSIKYVVFYEAALYAIGKWFARSCNSQ